MTDDSNVVPMPDTSVTFDLDAAKRPESEIKPPFVVKIGGRKVTLGDPADVDWKDLVVLEGPGELLKFTTSPEDLRHIETIDTEGWRFGQLLERYSEYYELDQVLQKAKRRAATGR